MQENYITNNLLEEKLCNICGSDEYKLKYHWKANYYNHQTFETCSWDGRQDIELKIVQCTSCSFMYSRPSFKISALDFVYPIDIISGINEQKNQKYSKLNLSKHLPFLEIIKDNWTPPKRILDIGTRYGELPYLARQANIEAFGIEYNKASVDIAKANGREYIFHGTIRDLPELKKTGKIPAFDIVTMDDVLEHLVDANEGIATISSLQKSGDLIITRQMDSDSLGHRLFGKNWYYLQPAAHMFYFNSKTASKLLENNEYRVIKIYKPSIISSIVETIFMEMKFLIARIIRRKSNWKAVNGKIMYLSKRKRGFYDMFTIVALKE
jgi:2-polyprenyl-3-methyl-5-hydroxy-6-metoxy-1,4-benzoquinol methylase